jgi:hypothetical protein
VTSCSPNSFKTKACCLHYLIKNHYVRNEVNRVEPPRPDNQGHYLLKRLTSIETSLRSPQSCGLKMVLSLMCDSGQCEFVEFRLTSLLRLLSCDLDSA